jgi:adenine/guanine phosphoribosyltransferase-like PRPP-binding protein
MFADRREAAARLADALQHYRGLRPLVLAIPRGAVPIGALLARRLQGELDLVMVRKLRAPGVPEFAVGAFDEKGWTYVAPHAAAAGVTQAYLEEERSGQLCEKQRRRALYTPDRATLDVAGRIAIVVDDRLATGATLQPGRRSFRVDGKPQLRRHAAAQDHVPGDVGGFHQIVLRTRGGLLEHQLLRSAAAQQHGQLVEQLAVPHQVPVLGRTLQRVPVAACRFRTLRPTAR